MGADGDVDHDLACVCVRICVIDGASLAAHCPNAHEGQLAKVEIVLCDALPAPPPCELMTDHG